MIDVRKRIDIQTEGLVAVATDGESAIVLLACEAIIELRIFFGDFADGLSFVFAEVDDDVFFVDDSSDWTHVLRGLC